MSYNESYLLYVIVDTVAAITGDDPEELFERLSTGPLEIDRRDYVEIIQHVEAVFDCTLHLLHRYDEVIDAQQIIEKLRHVS